MTADGQAPVRGARAVTALAAQELRLTARRGEGLLVTLAIPAAVLLFFGGTSIGSALGATQGTIVTGAVALAIIATGMVSLGIATAYERRYGVLKRLGGAPLPAWAFVAAKAVAVLAVVALQLGLLLGVALALGWSPGPGWSPVLLVVAVALGGATFTGLGLALAGALRAEAVLALANGLFLAFLLLGGLVIPVQQLPGFLQPVAAALPATALADALRIALDTGVATAAHPEPVKPLVLLALWAVAATALAARTFRWED